MGRWQPLRADLPPEAARLVRELRQYVDRCELNSAALAARTGYSRSSWLRYLSGRRLPPWPAVAGLGRLAQADAEHLRVLWVSSAGWSPGAGRAAAGTWTRTARSATATVSPSTACAPTGTC
ncbi:helix-turn-helix domain-containing protein [Actinacidiphila rubida]|uniref:helix-turn-helix domain-containing protein n=1 Tax=Actinacidiphila rubida TaxID=310780 RepID=UPI000A84E51B|nr:helix-turn-helix transcriptional regulator [Actinacidiphila rubida]